MYAAAQLAMNLSMEKEVLNLTLVDDDLFVLLDRDVNQVSVYRYYKRSKFASFFVRDYQLLRYLELPAGFERVSFSDITSCVQRKCLYMSDANNRCIHRYDLDGSATSKWLVPGEPLGLSVTLSCNLLVTLQGEPNKLVELSADSGQCGQCVREIALQADIKNPHYGVELTTDQFVLCHGVGDNSLHRVCVVGDDGKVTRSYGGQPGSDVEQLNFPCHLAVDKDSQFIFVADYRNDRVVAFGERYKTPQILKYLSLIHI